MKLLRIKYTLVQLVHWMISGALYGYLTVFLKAKGVPASQIGIVKGVGCVLAILFAPWAASLVQKYEKLTVKKLSQLLVLVMLVLAVMYGFLPIPLILVKLSCICLTCILISAAPLLSTIAMDYLQEGRDVNYGMARGFGSLGYALIAAFLGRMTEQFGVMIIFLIAVPLLVVYSLLLAALPESGSYTGNQKEKQGSILGIIRKYPEFTIILLGFSCSFAAASALETFLIYIVNQMGGSTTLYGLAFSAATLTELPAMVLAPVLRNKMGSRNALKIAAAAYVLRNILVCTAKSMPVLLAGQLMQGLSFGLFLTVIAYYVVDYLDRPDQLIGQTCVIVFFNGGGAMIGNVMGGILKDTGGLTNMYLFVVLLTMAGALLAGAALLRRRKNC